MKLVLLLLAALVLLAPRHAQASPGAGQRFLHQVHMDVGGGVVGDFRANYFEHVTGFYRAELSAPSVVFPKIVVKGAVVRPAHLEPRDPVRGELSAVYRWF